MAAAYLTALGLAAWVKPETFGPRTPTHRFAIVVPAHDEEKGLAATIANLRSLDYPPHLFDIVVVADNCTDRTAEVAKGFGVRCLERSDQPGAARGMPSLSLLTRC